LRSWDEKQEAEIPSWISASSFGGQLKPDGFSSEIRLQADAAPLEAAVSANLVERKSCVHRLHVEPSIPSNCQHSPDFGEMFAQIGKLALPYHPE
jgi:hypothetical protein